MIIYYLYFNKENIRKYDYINEKIFINLFFCNYVNASMNAFIY